MQLERTHFIVQFVKVTLAVNFLFGAIDYILFTPCTCSLHQAVNLIITSYQWDHHLVFACGRTEKARVIVAITCRAFGRALAFLSFVYVVSYGPVFLVCYCESLVQCRCTVVAVVTVAAAGMV